MTAREVIDKRFGVRTRAEVNPLVAQVGVAAIRVLPNNPDRLAWLIVNLSGNTLQLALDRGVGAARGILVQANGGSVGMVVDEDFDMVTYEIWGVATGAASNIYVLSVVEY